MEGSGIMRVQRQSHGGRRHMFGIGVAILAMLLIGLIQPVGARADLARCENFDTQQEAQAVLDQNPEFDANLDPDGDGIACEELPLVDPSPTDDFTSCEQFETQADAQRELNKRTDDSLERRFALDADGDGVACEDTFGVGDGEQTDDLPTCDDFANQEEAQAYFDNEATDLQGPILDPDGDFLACEDAYRAPTVVVCAEDTGTLIEVPESVQDGLDIPNHRATQEEIAAGTCAVTVPVTPGGEGEPEEDADSDDDAGQDAGSDKVVTLPKTGTGATVEQAQQGPLLAVLVVLTVGAIGLRSRIQLTRA